MAPTISPHSDLRAQIRENCLFILGQSEADLTIILTKESPDFVTPYTATVLKSTGRTWEKLYSSSPSPSPEGALRDLLDETSYAVNTHIKTHGFAIAQNVKKRKPKKSQKANRDVDSGSDTTSSATTVEGYETFSDDDTVSVMSVSASERRGRRRKDRERSTKKSTRKTRRARSRSPSSSSSSSDSEMDGSSIARPRVSVIPPLRAFPQRPTVPNPYVTRPPPPVSQPAPQLGVAVPPPPLPGSQQPHVPPVGPYPQRIMPLPPPVRLHDICLIIKHRNGSTETVHRTIGQVARFSQRIIEQGALAHLRRQSLLAQPGNGNNAAYPTTENATDNVSNGDTIPPLHRRIPPLVRAKVKSVSLDGSPYDLSTYQTDDLTKAVEMLRAEAKNSSAIPRFQVDVWNEPCPYNLPAAPWPRMSWGYSAVPPPAVEVSPSSQVPSPPPPPPPPLVPVLASASPAPPPVPRSSPVPSAQASTGGVVHEGSAPGRDARMG